MLSFSSSPPGSRELLLILGPLLLGVALCLLAFVLVLRPGAHAPGVVTVEARAALGGGSP